MRGCLYQDASKDGDILGVRRQRGDVGVALDQALRRQLPQDLGAHAAEHRHRRRREKVPCSEPVLLAGGKGGPVGEDAHEDEVVRGGAGSARELLLRRRELAPPVIRQRDDPRAPAQAGVSISTTTP